MSNGARIVMVEPGGRGGVCHHAYNLCRALVGQGCDIHLITDGSYELEMLPQNYPISKFALRTPRGLLGSLRTIRSLKPDIIHYQGTNLHPFYEWIYKVLCRILTGAKFVAVAHEVIPHIPPGWQRPFIGMKLRSADAVIVHSKNTCREALEISVPPDKVHVIPIGDFRFLRELATLGKPAPWTISPDLKYVLFFGGIMKYKGLSDLIRAVAKLKDAGRPIGLMIAGKPVDPWSEYEALIREVGIEDRTLLSLGYINVEDISGYFESAAAICIPYTFCSESAVLLAADAMDKPVVATSVGGNVAAHADGLVEQLVPPNDADALAAALDKTLFDFDREEYLMRKAARDPSIRNWNVIADQTINLYDSISPSPQPSPVKGDGANPTTLSLTPRVTVVIPARNEEKYISRCLTDIMNGDYPRELLEVLVLDGCSDDKTAEVVEQLAKSSGWDNLKIVNNPGKTQSHAMNLGISLATSDFILRVDAHCEYPVDYLSKLVTHIVDDPEVYVVAGILRLKPAADTPEALAIAAAYAHRFATGNATQRIGVSKPTYVETVGLGLYRREAFDRFGGFDAELLRAEDQEMNCRIFKGGGKILCVPDTGFDYHARPTYRLFARMFYQYGLFKPLAARKMGKPLSVRQFVPFAALTFAAACVAGAVFLKSMLPLVVLLATVCAYLGMSVVSAVDAVLKFREKGFPKQRLLLIPRVCVAFWIAHWCFGFGNVVGLIRFMLLRQRLTDIAISR